MGHVQSVPVLGEIVTIVESSVKFIAAGTCMVMGGIIEPVIYIRNTWSKKAQENPLLNAAGKLCEGAGNSLAEYTEKNMIVGCINMKIKRCKGDTEGAERIKQKILNSLEGFADSMPVLGHFKGACHYIDGNTEHGYKCMLSATRLPAILASGVITGVLGGGATLAGVFGICTGIIYDLVVSIIYSNKQNEERLHGTISCVGQILETGDLNALVDLLLIAAADFASAAAAQNIVEAIKLKNASKKAQKSLTETNSAVKGDGPVSTLAEDIRTN